MPKAKTAGDKVIAILDARKGFDYWWEEVSPASRREIIAKINEAVTLKDQPAR